MKYRSTDPSSAFINVSQHEAFFFFIIPEQAEYSLTYNTTNIEFVPAIKLSYPTDRFQPSISIGPSIGLPISKDITLINIDLDNATRTPDRIQNPLDINYQIGYQLQLAVDYLVTKRLGVSLYGAMHQHLQLGGINPKFDVSRASVGVSMFWKGG